MLRLRTIMIGGTIATMRITTQAILNGVGRAGDSGTIITSSTASGCKDRSNSGVFDLENFGSLASIAMQILSLETPWRNRSFLSQGL